MTICGCVAGSYFGTVVSMAVSGALAESAGWPSIFYVFGECRSSVMLAQLGESMHADQVL